MGTSNIQIRLSPAELRYLVGSRFLNVKLLDVMRSAREEGHRWAVSEVPRDLVEVFRAAFTDRLAKVGFDANCNPTPEGRLLESLIDRFFVVGGQEGENGPEGPGRE